MNLELKVLDLGRINYEDAWKTQKDLFEKRKLGKEPDTLLLAEHPPTITFGLNDEWNVMHVSKRELLDRGIAFYKADRGGGAAYLGPGQLIGYTIMDIKPFGNVLQFMRLLEEVMIKTADDFSIKIGRYDVKNPTTEKPYRATWYRNGSDYVLCTKGIKVQLFEKGSYTHHGFCLNVNQNKSYYDLIDPCGFPIDIVMPISIGEILGKKVDVNIVKDRIVSNFKEVFNYG